MTRKLTAVALAMLMLMSVGGVVAQSQAPSSPGPADQAPDNAKPFGNTSAITDNQTANGSEELAGKMRIEDQYLNNTTVSLEGNTTGNYTFNVNVSHGPNETVENVTMFVQEQAVESSTGVNISDVHLKINGNNVTYYEDSGPGNSPWVGFVVPEFSENTVTFEAAATGGGGGSLMDVSTDPLGLPVVGGIGLTYILVVVLTIGGVGGVYWYMDQNEETEYH